MASTSIISLSDLTKADSAGSLSDDFVLYEFNRRNVEALRIFPLRIDALIFGLCRKGRMRVALDLKEYEMVEDSILIIQHRNFIDIKEMSDDFECVAVACSRKIIEVLTPKLTSILPLLMQQNTEPLTHLTEKGVANLMWYFEGLKRCLRETPGHFTRPKTLTLLLSSMYEIIEQITEMPVSPTKPGKSRKEEIMAKFLIFLSEDFRKTREVSHYAERLCITPKHLSSVVKSLSGVTASEWIENYVVKEARVLLMTTDMSVQEIANMLNFPNQSFFGKYFKHKTGMSPTEYRSNN